MNKFAMPKGLPACLASDQEGFNRLCKILGIRTRADRQRIAKHRGVKRDLKRSGHKPRIDLQTAGRLRHDLSTFYSLPACRRNLWRFVQEDEEVGEILRDQGAGSGYVPSLEQCVIADYDEGLLDTEIDEDELSHCQDLFDPTAKSIDWQHPGLVALSHIRNDLENWDKLDSTKQEHIVLAAFAVSTILDDVRLIVHAADKIDVFANEFGFLLDQSPAHAKDNPDESADSSIDQEQVVIEMRDACNALAATASRLAEEPSLAKLYDKLSNQADKVLSLRDSVLTYLTPSAEDLLLDVARTITGRASAVPNLEKELDGIYEVWEQAYPYESADIDQLWLDVKRLTCELPQAIDEWTNTSAEIIRLERECEAVQRQASTAKGPTDRVQAFEQISELYENLAKATEQQERAKRNMLKVASPTRHESKVDPRNEAEPSEAEDEGVILQSDETTHEEFQNRDEPEAEGQVGATVFKPVSTDPLTPAAAKHLPVIQQDTQETGEEIQQPGLPQHYEEIESPSNLASIALWRAIAQDRLGIAYHIAVLAQKDHTECQEFPPLDLIAAAAMGNAVNNCDGNLVQPLAECLSKIGEKSLKRDDKDQQDALNLMLVSATLFPTLFEPATGALSLLRRFEASTRFSTVYDFTDAVVRGAEPLQTVHLRVRELQSALDETAWADNLEDHKRRVRIWGDEASGKRVLFGPAQQVWRFWQSKRGILSELAEHCCQIDKAAMPRVREILNELEDAHKFKVLVRSTDRNDLGRNTGNDIEARALTQLRGRVDPIVGLANEWLRLIETRPNPEGFIEKKIRHLLQDVVRLGPSTLDSIKVVADSPETSLPLSAALTRCRASLKALIDVFNGKEVDAPRHVDSPSRVLSRDLLFVTDLDIDTESGTIEHNSETALSLLIDSDSHASTLKNAFDARLVRGDLAGAAFVCEEMGTAGDPDEESCRETLEDVERKLRRELRDSWVTLTEEIETCYYFGGLSNTDRDNLVATLPTVANISARGGALVEIQRTFAVIRVNLDDCQATIRNNYEKAFTTVDSRLRMEGAARVHEAVESRDWKTVAELLERLQENESIGDVSRKVDPFESFMAATRRIENCYDGMDRSKPDEIIRAAAERASIAGISFASMSADEAQQAGMFLAVWYQMAHSDRVCDESISKFMTMLGFVVKDVQAKPDKSVLVTTEPLRQRALCPLHIFGSSANGKYRIVLNWRMPARDFIIQSIGDVRSGPTIVFHFGHLGKDRERLRKWATRESQRLLLVMDETLILYLSTQPSGRLTTMFRCAAPFTAAEPFVTTSSLVPPEMFFGRSREREEIMDRYGSCFVYGGRQIGKTALLRSAEEQFNDPAERRLGKWIDLKSHGIGEDKQPEDIWRLLWRELSSNLFARGQREPKGNSRLKEEFIQAVRDWTNEHDDGRLLLLLDEADKFLELDARDDFPESTSLKGLMEGTERRFKVVFSGLHNVLRTTERANHPLIHLGTPICVEPLLSNGEWREARQLIRDPLAAIGCRFERDNIVTHILAHTNYFPSLIQLCGASLVEYLRDSNKVFPYEITVRDVYAVFKKDELRQNIRDRFLATLRLDPRYEVIAYALAYALAQESPGNHASLADGLNRFSIMQEVRSWWAAGFNTTDAEFAALLDEMVGLGVLRVVQNSESEDKRYTIRNPNIRVLLGSKEDIEEALLKEDRELPAVFEPALYHARFDRDHDPRRRDHDPRRRGPLTSEHEGRLNRGGGVTVVSGVEATNIEQIGVFLEGRVDPGMYRELPPCTDAHQFQRAVTKLRPDPKRGTHIYLVPLDTPWSCQWLRLTLDALRRIKNGRYIRVVFLAGPNTLWTTLIDIEGDWGLRGVDWMELRPWSRTFIRQWCSDLNLQVDKEIKELVEFSGGWASILEKYDLTVFPWSRRMNELKNMVNEERSAWLVRLGICEQQSRHEVHALVDNNVCTVEDAKSLVERLTKETESTREPFDIKTMSRRFIWMKRLHLIEQCENGRWSYNSLLKRLLMDTS